MDMFDDQDNDESPVFNKQFLEGFHLLSSQIVLPLEWEPPIFPVKQMWLGESNAFCSLMENDEASWLHNFNQRTRVRNQIYRYITANGNYEKAVEEVLVHLLLLYQQLKRRSDSRNIATHLLAMSAHICEKYRPKKADFIKYIMGEYVSNGNDILNWFEFINPVGGLEVLRYSMLYPFKIGRIVNPITDDWITQKHLDALEFYLKHGNTLTFVATAKAFFLNDSDKDQPVIEEHVFDCITPLVDFPAYSPVFGVVTPLTLACMTANIKAVMILLRHGAFPIHSYCIQKNPYRNWESPLFVVGNQLAKKAEYVFPNPHVPASQNNHLRLFHIHRCSKLVKCLRLLMRAQPFLPMRFEGRICDEGVPPKDASTSIMCFDERLCEMIPECLIEEVPSLQRQCRWAIRRELRVRRSLPEGVMQLELPHMLKMYLDLQVD